MACVENKAGVASRAVRAAVLPRLDKALGSLRHTLALREASGERAGRGL